MSNTISNPLVNFRAPHTHARNRARVVGDHFDVGRGEVENEQSFLNVYQRDFKYLPDPTLEIDIATWEDAPIAQSRAQYYSMTNRKGFNVAMASDFEVLDDRLALTWKADASGRLTFEGKSENTMVLMWRTGKEYDRCETESLKWSTDVQKTVEEKMAESAGKASRGHDVSVEVQLEDDDGDETESHVKRKRR